MTVKTLFLKACAALPGFFCLSLLFVFFSPAEALCGLFSVLLHECGHLFFFYRSCRRLPRFSAQAGGFLLSTEPMPLSDELLYAGGGVLFNLLSLPPAALFYQLSFLPELSAVFFAFSLLYALFNLLPAPPLDGGRLLYITAAAVFGDAPAYRIGKTVAGLVTLLLLFLSLYLLLGSGGFLYGIFFSFRLLAAYFETF